MSIPDAVLQDAIIAYHCSVQGANHIKSDKPCEDASAHFAEDGLYICAVADGHGSSEYPRTEKGSQFAVECTIRLLKEFSQMKSILAYLYRERGVLRTIKYESSSLGIRVNG